MGETKNEDYYEERTPTEASGSAAKYVVPASSVAAMFTLFLHLFVKELEAEQVTIMLGGLTPILNIVMVYTIKKLEIEY